MVVLSMLGMGNYKRTDYCWGDKVFAAVLFPVALANWFPDAQIVALATDEAMTKHGRTLLDAIPYAKIVPIPTGRSDDELWRIFGSLSDCLSSQESVLLDITRGFRSLAIVSLLSISFLRVAKRVDLIHVLYGAFEAINPESGFAPVFDLTPFVQMLDWSSATDLFLDTGDATKLAHLITKGEMYSLNPPAQHMERLSNALAEMRASEVLHEARNLNLA